MRSWLYSIVIIGLSGLTFLFFQNATNVAKSRFSIYAQIGYMPESLPENNNDFEIFRARVDGWSFASPPGTSILSYWPKRPIECTINYKRVTGSDGGTVESFRLNGNDYTYADRETCYEEKAKYFQKTKPASFPGTLNQYIDFEKQAALDRLLLRLRVKEDQLAGRKKVSSNMLIKTFDFSYDRSSDKLDMIDEPDEVKVLLRNDINLDHAMIYNEPSGQVPDGTVPLIPLVRGGVIPPLTAQNCPICLPHNSRVIDMFGMALKKRTDMSTKAMYNVRKWNDEMEKDVSAVLDSPHFGGVNFEGGVGKIDELEKQNYDKGLAWLLKNLRPGQQVSYLVPAAIDHTQTNTERERDISVHQNLILYISTLNKLLREELGLPSTANPICNPKIIITVASYGNPIRIELYPTYRKSETGEILRRAGTVMGLVQHLSDYRNRLCNL